MAERTEEADAGPVEAGEQTLPRPAEGPEPEAPGEQETEPAEPRPFDELVPMAAEAGDPGLVLPEPDPPAEPEREAAEPDLPAVEGLAPAEVMTAPEWTDPEAPAETLAEAEPDRLVADSALPAEEPITEPLPELEPDPLPTVSSPVEHEPERAVSASEPAVEHLHERIPTVLPSVALHPVSPAVAVPVFEAPARVPEIPQPIEDIPADSAEPVPAVSVAAVAIPQEADIAAPPRPAIEVPPRPQAAAPTEALVRPETFALRHPEPSALLSPEALAPSRPEVGAPPRTLGHYLRLAVRLVALATVSAAVLVLTLIVLYRWVNPPASTLMLGQWVTGTKISQRWVPIDRISPYLHRAVITAEDGRFCQHHGVDWEEIEVAIERARDGIPRGGSTISMQVVKNLFLWPSKSYVRKAIEIPLTYAIELVWTKRRILEIYLNIAEWGPGVFGAEAAARYHFGKPALLLTPGQAALLAVALPNPLERKAGSPGPGTQRLATTLNARMRASSANAACVGGPR